MGFDVDAACVLYNGSTLLHALSRSELETDCCLGQDVFAAPRAVVAMMRQCNMVDLTRRSPSYEYRLLKYRHRGYEVRYPQLRREDVRSSVRSFRFNLELLPIAEPSNYFSFIILNFPVYQRGWHAYLLSKCFRNTKTSHFQGTALLKESRPRPRP